MILAKLSEHKNVLTQQSEALKSSMDDSKISSRGLEHTSSSTSVPVTPATEIFPSAGPNTRPASTSNNQGDGTEEVLQLKLRLAEAQAKLSHLEVKNDSQNFKEADASRGHGQMPALAPEQIWANEEYFSEAGDSLVTMPSNRTTGSAMLSGNVSNLRGPFHPAGIPPPSSDSSNGSSWFGPRNNFNQTFADTGNSYNQPDGYRSSDRLTPDSDMFFRPAGGRRGNRFDSRYSSPAPLNGSYGHGPFSQPVGQYDMIPGQPAGGASIVPGTQGIGIGVYPGYQSQTMPSALSPHATEFTSSSGWKNEVCPQLSRPSPFSVNSSSFH